MLKQIEGTNGKYAAGSDGEIYCYSKARNNARKPYPFPLAKRIGSNGYYFVAIIIKGKRKTQAIHPLICRAFHGEKPENCQLVRHVDGVKLHNLPGNLRWGTYYQNEADKRRHGTVACGEKQGSSKLTAPVVMLLRKAIPLGLWNEDDAAKVLGMKADSIKDIVEGRTWKHLL